MVSRQTHVSSAPMSSRSSTSRKTETPGRSRQSCRLMFAHWSWPVHQMWLLRAALNAGGQVVLIVAGLWALPHRNICHLWPFARARSGIALVAFSLMIGSCAALTRSCAAIAPMMTSAAASEMTKPTVTTVSSKMKSARICKLSEASTASVSTPN